MKKILIIILLIVLAGLIGLSIYSLNRDSLLDKYAGKKDFEEIKSALQENLNFIKKNPNNDSAYYSLGQGLFTIGGYDDAVWAFENTVRIAPDKDYYWSFLGKAYQDKKDYVKARDAYIKALELNPNSIFHYAPLAWLYYFRLDAEKDKAYDVLKKGLEKFPTDENLLFDITRYYLYDKNEKEFRKYASRYLKVNPDNQLIKDAYQKGIK